MTKTTISKLVITELTVQRDGKVTAGNHCSAGHALGPKHPQDVKRRRPVDEISALITGGRPKQTHLFPEVDHHVPLRNRAYDAALAGGEPCVGHGRSDLVEKLSVAFHFAKTNPLDNS